MRLTYRQQSLLLVNKSSRLKLNTDQLIHYFSCNNYIINFFSNNIPFCITLENLRVSSDIFRNNKTICIATEHSLIYIPMKTAFKILDLQKLFKNNVTLVINLHMGVKNIPESKYYF